MFIQSISSDDVDFDDKRSFNTLKLIILTEEVYLITCIIYDKNIITNNQNNSNSVR